MSWRASPRKTARWEAQAEAERTFHTPWALMLGRYSVTFTCRNCHRAQPVDLEAWERRGCGGVDLREIAPRLVCEKARGGCGTKGWVVVGVKR